MNTPNTGSGPTGSRPTGSRPTGSRPTGSRPGRTDGANGTDDAGGAGGTDGVWLPWRTAAERALYGTEGVGAGPEAATVGGRADGTGTGVTGQGVRGPGVGGSGVGGPGVSGTDASGTGGFFVREAPAAHFRTSVHASPLFAVAVARLLRHVDDALGRPAELAMVDVGAGRGELLTGVLDALPEEVAARVRPYAVERAPRPEGLDERIVWSHQLPAPREAGGLLFANEWLDNVPVDIAEIDPDGVPRTVLVRPSDGAERLGDPVCGPDAEWLERWWPLGPADPDRPPGPEEPPGLGGPLGGASGRVEPGPRAEPGQRAEPGLRAEIGRPRDDAWAAAVRTLGQGLAVAVDFAHFRENRPPFGTLTGYLDGREVRPVPDGSRDLTAHVAIDACAAAGARAAAARKSPGASAAETAGAAPPAVRSQREALHSLGIAGGRPPLSLASSDPAAYVRQLASAGEAAELTGNGGLGSFSWLIQPLGGVPSPFG